MNKPHILIIEDDPSVCELLHTFLQKERYRLSVVHSGEEGLGVIEEDPPNLVILDLKLPGMNGLDVCRALRRDPWMNKIPILMLTGQAEEDDVVIGLEVGADDYMAKPFSPKLLLARVKALIRRSIDENASRNELSVVKQENGEPQLRIKTLGYCELRFADRNLPWGVAFSPAQRQLLAMLIASPQCRVSQEEIQASFWPDSSASRARSSVDSLISRVRKTLDEGLAPFDSKQFLTIKRGILSLENCRIDAVEFIRLIKKGLQQAGMHHYWQAEMAFSSALSLWQGTFLPADFGSDEAVQFQDELEQLYLEGCQMFSRILAETGRFQEAAKLLRYAQRYNPTDDQLMRLLYQLTLAQNLPGQARQLLQSYEEALLRADFSGDEVREILAEMPQSPPNQSWLADR